MHIYSFDIYSYIFFATTIIAVIVGFALWPRREIKGALWLFFLEVAAAQWAFSLAIETAAATESLKYFWSAVAYFGTTSVPVFFFLFGFEYHHSKNSISRKALYFFAVIYIVIMVMTFTNHLHHLLWPSITINSETNLAVYSHGLFWWLLYAYEYILIFGGFYFLINAAFRYGTFYTLQNLALIVGAILPITGNLIYVFGKNPISGIDWTPVGFALSGVLLAWGILNLKFFKLAPIARTVIVENMVDGVIVLDSKNQIVDTNPACSIILQRDIKQIIGSDIYQLFPLTFDLDQFLQSIDYLQKEIDLSNIKPVHNYELRLSIIHDRFNRMIGKILVLRDITEQKKIEAEREKLITELQNATNKAKTLSGLLPICASCKKIRDDEGYWHNVEEYIQTHSEADFTHGICPECMQKYYPDIAAKVKSRQDKKTG